MNSLYRELAPIPEAAWKQIEAEASQTLKRTLAARKLVDFDGPHGWHASSVDPGRTQALMSTPHPGVETRLRKVQPLVELRIPFELARHEIDAIDRGAEDADLQPVSMRHERPHWQRMPRYFTVTWTDRLPGSVKPPRTGPSRSLMTIPGIRMWLLRR
jgi:uncharacterized linocin/CFP29 family protein